MGAALMLLAALLLGSTVWAEESARREAPSYSTASIVNSATNLAGELAPNTIATIYGTGLANTVRALRAEDIRNGTLPFELSGAGVRVLVGTLPAQLYYVSPTQVNFLIPPNLKAGDTDIQLTLDGRAGPAVRLKLLESAPALFQLDSEMAVATRADGSVVTREQPAAAGEVIVLYATGLGRTDPDAEYGLLPLRPAYIRRFPELAVWLGGKAIDSRSIFYAGVTPGFAGLYQINLTLPEKLELNPEVRVILGSQASPAGVHLPARPQQ